MRYLVLAALLAAGAAAAVVLDVGGAQSLTFPGFCTGWQAWRRGNELIVTCPGRPLPAGAAPLYCLGTPAQCGRA